MKIFPILVTAAVRLIVLLFLLPLLSAGQSVKLQQSAELLNQAFPQRLEAGFRYQEAVLPVGRTSCKSYLKMGPRRYLLAETSLLLRDDILRQDSYILDKQKDALQTSFQSRHLLEVSPGRSSAGVQVSYYHAYVFTDESVRQTIALLLQNFAPLRLLEEQPVAGQQLPATGKQLFFYVIDNRPAWEGDTLASYQVERDSSYACHLTLYERLDASQHRRHANYAGTQTWTRTWQEPGQGRLVSERGGLRWTRQYRKAHDFTETLETTGLSLGLGGGAGVHALVYQRHYRRRGPHRAVDAYVLPSSPANAAPVKFSILHVEN